MNSIPSEILRLSNETFNSPTSVSSLFPKTSFLKSTTPPSSSIKLSLSVLLTVNDVENQSATLISGKTADLNLLSLSKLTFPLAFKSSAKILISLISIGVDKLPRIFKLPFLMLLLLHPRELILISAPLRLLLIKNLAGFFGLKLNLKFPCAFPLNIPSGNKTLNVSKPF